MFDIDAHHAKRPMRLVQPDTIDTTDPTLGVALQDWLIKNKIAIESDLFVSAVDVAFQNERRRLEELRANKAPHQDFADAHKRWRWPEPVPVGIVMMQVDPETLARGGSGGSGGAGSSASKDLSASIDVKGVAGPGAYSPS